MESNLRYGRLPKIVTKDMYFRLDTYELVNMHTIDKDIEREIKECTQTKLSNYRKNIINDLTNNLEKIFIAEKLVMFFDKSYLVKIKKGQDLDQVSKLAEASLEDYDNEIKAMFNILNSRIRQIVKDRKNDYDKVIKTLHDKAAENLISLRHPVKESSKDIDEDDDYDLDLELQNSIEAEEDKANKLNKYIDKAFSDMEASCHAVLKNMYKEYYNQFIQAKEKEIEDRLHIYEKEILSNQMVILRSNKKNSVINLYKTLTKTDFEHIKWLDDGKKIVMATTIDKDGDTYTVTSGKVFPTKITFSLEDISYLEIFGNTITAVLEKKL